MAKKAYIGVDGKARKIKKGYIGVENFVPRALPSGYTQVEYIQSSGTQYVDTGVAHASSSNIVLQADLSYDTVSPSNQIMGFNGSAGNGIGTSGAAWWEASSIANATVGTRYSLEWGVNGSNWHRTVNGKTVTGTRSSTSFTTNLYLFAAQASATSTSMSYYCSCKLYSAKVLVNGNVVRDFVPCKNSSGTVGLYDVANGSFYQNSGSGTFVAGATGGSVARKIKKAYIGIGGVARPCFGNGEPTYYGAITSLFDTTMELAATTVGDYAMFSGGRNGSTFYASNTFYNSSLSRSYTTNMGTARAGLAATTVGNYAIFGGGRTKASTTFASFAADAYNKSMTKESGISSLRQYASSLAATTVSTLALFGGGIYDNSRVKTMTAYNASLSRINTVPDLTAGGNGIAATSIGEYALFGGGNSYSATVNGYNTSLTSVSVSSLSVGRLGLSATSNGHYALFGGGIQAITTQATVDCYDSSLVRTSLASGLSAHRYRLAATSIGEFAFFGGGEPTTSNGSSMSPVNNVDVFDASLTRTNPTGLATARSYLAATTVGNFALFGGGSGGGSVVEAYTVV